MEKILEFTEGYKAFLAACKTERECISFAVAEAEKHGYTPFSWGMPLKAGDKIYFNNKEKSLILAQIGSESLSKGANIVASHIDACRLDLKQNPLYEKGDIALLKTHYYGGIKKYQWVAIPLALHGVVFLKSGDKIQVTIGEHEDDPVFYVSDLLPHLAQEQMKRPASEIIKGEELNVIFGSLPLSENEKDAVKANVLNILFETYGIEERDFLSAEIEMVPALKPKDVGIDRSMIGAYGHDDRVCAYTSLMAMFEAENVERTSVLILADKEEVGSQGVSGMQSRFFSYFMQDLAETLGCNIREVLSSSYCLSADVNSAYDPTFDSVFENQNTSYINKGVVVTKYTGARGKSGSSDASSEYVHYVHTLLEEAGVNFQTGELGKVDLGGGGTVAAYMANYNIDTIDVGVPVISMHAPFELVSKKDVYAAYQAFLAFLKK